jgi:hypothetical protein
MTWRVMGRDYTLDHMEHVILRKELAEPRVHFVRLRVVGLSAA